MKAAMKLKGFRSEASNELLSEHMLAGIPEVDLGYKCSHFKYPGNRKEEE
ncbi:hypothetical protein OESDEN_17727 [Oesophagostomum dentatum]|uniref:Uncharacterized protein n=1 Tax=Oesophagostomum dentatum TaxID=61180 RepID=A0A0B1SCD9_OESDE|nr:hypothetical protein OESDEN_17727 [Oesophagostomum dentatum]